MREGTAGPRLPRKTNEPRSAAHTGPMDRADPGVRDFRRRPTSPARPHTPSETPAEDPTVRMERTDRAVTPTEDPAGPRWTARTRASEAPPEDYLA